MHNGTLLMAKTESPGQIGRVLIGILGIAAILGVSLGAARYVRGQLTERLLAQEGLVKQEFLESILAAEKSAGSLFEAPAPSPALQSFAAHVRSLPEIVRANIYSPDGVIRHSTDANLVGLHFSDNDELAEAFMGKIKSAIEFDEANKAEHLALSQMPGEALIEAYIPVRDGAGKVAAVVEFYRKETWIAAAAAEAERGIWLTGFASAALLLAMWFLGLRRR